MGGFSRGGGWVGAAEPHSLGEGVGPSRGWAGIFFKFFWLVLGGRLVGFCPPGGIWQVGFETVGWVGLGWGVPPPPGITDC